MVAKSVTHIPIGQIINTFVSDDIGRIMAIVWVVREEKGYLIISDGEKRDVLKQWFDGHKVADVAVEDVTESYECLSLVGPESLAILLSLLGDDIIGLSYLSSERLGVGDISCTVCRIGYSGEYEYRFMTAPGHAGALLQKMQASAHDSGITLALCGNSIMDTLMLEMKSLNQRLDFEATSNPFELGLHGMISFRKEAAYSGKQALLAMKDSGADRKVMLVVVDDLAGADEIPKDCPVSLGGSVAGKIFHAGYSFTEKKVIGLALLDKTVAWPFIDFEIATKSGLKKTVSTLIPPLFITKTVKNASQN
jgi:glycine cleavage system aminomethyltransferase T